MNLKKIVSLFASAAVTVSCAAGMLTFGAGAAYSRYMAHYIDRDDPTKEINTYVTLTELFSNSSYKTYYPYLNLYATENIGVNTMFTASDMNVFIYNDLALKVQVTDGIFTYSTELSSANVSNVPAAGINIALKLSAPSYSDSEVKTFTIQNAGVGHDLGGVKLTYKFSYQDWQNLLTYYKIPEQTDIYFCYSNAPAVYYKMYGQADATFPLTGDQTITFVYDKNAEYLGESSSAKAIRKAVIDSIGAAYTLDSSGEPVLTDTSASLAAYVDKTAADITGRIFVNDITKRAYILSSGLGNYISEYFDARTEYGTLTTEAESHLKALALALMQSDENKKILEDAVYTKFGVETTSKAADQLIDAITPAVTEKLTSQIIANNARPSDYSTNIRYFLSGMALTEAEGLKARFDAVKEAFTDIAANTAPTVNDILNSINAMSTSLVDSSGNAYELTEILRRVYDLKTGSYANASLTLGEALAHIAYGNTVTGQYTYSSTTPYISDTNTNYTSTAPTLTGTQNYYTNSYIPSTDMSDYTKRNYVDAQDQYLQQQINQLTTLVQSLQNDVAALKITYSQLPYSQTLYDWASSNSVDTDTFISQVAAKVSEKLGAGQSAYDIAVKNGFVGTEQEWLSSLVGKSAYEIAVKNGYIGSESEWLDSLKSGDSTSDSEKIIYVYGTKSNSAAPDRVDVSTENVNVTSAGSSADDSETAHISAGSSYGTITAGNAAPAGTGSSSNNNTTAAANNTATVNTAKTSGSANTTTAAAAVASRPATAAASLVLTKKDKRRRGRK